MKRYPVFQTLKLVRMLGILAVLAIADGADALVAGGNDFSPIHIKRWSQVHDSIFSP